MPFLHFVTTNWFVNNYKEASVLILGVSVLKTKAYVGIVIKVSVEKLTPLNGRNYFVILKLQFLFLAFLFYEQKVYCLCKCSNKSFS